MLMWVSGGRPLLCLEVWRNGACRVVTVVSRVALGAQRAALVRRTMASSASHGPVYTAIVRKVTESLAPEALELYDDSASHAGHSGMKGREAVEVCSLVRLVMSLLVLSSHARGFLGSMVACSRRSRTWH